MLYCEPYSKALAKELLEGVEKVGLDICYRDNPTDPLILSLRAIDQNPYKNKRYTNESETNEIKQAEVETELKIGKY